MDFIEFLGWIAFLYITWQLLKSWIFVQQLRHRVEDALNKEEASRAIEKQVLSLRFEHVKENGHSIVLAYSKNNRFLGQGPTEAEVENNLQKCYPDHKILIVNEKATVTEVLDPLDTKSI